MGRNYTLYIKHDSFDTEPNKSGLVNELLERHYTTQFEHKPLPAPRPRESSITFPKASTGMFDRNVEFCKHDQVKGLCTKGCK